MRRLIDLFLAALAVLSFAAARAAADVPAGQRDQIAETLRYGIDSQVLDALKIIKDARDTSFTSVLAETLVRSGSSDVRRGILDLFAEQKQAAGQEAARLILSDWLDQKQDLVTSAIGCLSAIGAPDLAKALIPLIDIGDSTIALKAIDALGKTGDKTAVKALLDALSNPDFPPDRKPQVILALGSLKDPSAVDPLMAIVEDDNEETVWRLYAADSLGKIGDPKAIPALKTLMGASDALSRTYAASAIARFDPSLVIQYLLLGLRDDNYKVRVECAKALAGKIPAGSVQEAAAILTYKAENDPVSQVRLEALNTLDVMGGEGAKTLFLRLFSKTGTPVDEREKSLTLLLRKGVTSVEADSIRKVIGADAAAHDQKALSMEARALAGFPLPSPRSVLLALLENQDYNVRLNAIRAVELNGAADLKTRLMEMAAKDPVPGVKAEALRVAEKL